jgi:hypothetical protein
MSTTLLNTDVRAGQGGFTHERSVKCACSLRHEWLTPPKLLKALGSFDLDPCSPVDRPWDTAAKHYTFTDDGLSQQWHGRVWCNPPYGAELSSWLCKLSRHGNGIALTFARTETAAFQRYVFPIASALLFIAGRVKFHRPDGSPGESAAAPSVLIAYGISNADCLRTCGITGAFVKLGVTP